MTEDRDGTRLVRVTEEAFRLMAEAMLPEGTTVTVDWGEPVEHVRPDGAHPYFDDHKREPVYSPTITAVRHLGRLLDRAMARHQRVPSLGADLCDRCEEPWPCEAAELAEALRALRRRTNHYEGDSGHCALLRGRPECDCGWGPAAEAARLALARYDGGGRP